MFLKDCKGENASIVRKEYRNAKMGFSCAKQEDKGSMPEKTE